MIISKEISGCRVACACSGPNLGEASQACGACRVAVHHTASGEASKHDQTRL